MSLNDEFAYHEVLDRSSVIVSMIEDHILAHPVVMNDKQLLKKAEVVVRIMADFYQLVGYKSYVKFDQDKEV